MTEKQQQVFREIMNLANEHFDSSVFVANMELDDGGHDNVEMAWRGGFTSAAGLLTIGLARLKARSSPSGSNQQEEPA